MSAASGSHWTDIEALFNETIEQPESQRAGFLDARCTDPAVRAEVESLLREHQSGADEAIERLATDVLSRWASQAGGALTGTTLGRYAVGALIGAGGMGEVYRATDTVLGRAVALKLLDPMWSADPDRARRFAEEARAASSLNHPNIITIYETGSVGGHLFIATEIVEGETLRSRMTIGSLTALEIADIGTQTAAALEAAHGAGIVHRDIKPENVMVRRDGYVKVVDFGIAKLSGDDSLAPGAPLRLTRGPLTQVGAVVGTVAYMSPEQAAGLPVDHRSDIYSTGLLLREMAALCTDPDAADLFRPVIDRAIALDALARYQTAAALKTDLKSLHTRLTAADGPTRSAWPRRTAWIASAVALAIAGAVVFRGRSAPGVSQHATYQQITDRPELEEFPTLSPDGATVVFSRQVDGRWRLFRQRIGESQAVAIGSGGENDRQPAFSPDGRRIAFRSDRDGGGIFIVDANGGNAVRAGTSGYNPAWSPDGRTLVVSTEDIETADGRYSIAQLWTIDVASGSQTLLTKGDAVQPAWSPHGSRIAYWWSPEGQRDIWTIKADGSDPVRVTDDPAVDWNPVWAPDGRALYWVSDRGGSGMNLWRIEIDERTGRTRGQPEPLNVASASAMPPTLSADGTRLAYVQLIRRMNILRLALDPKTGAVRGNPEWVVQESRPTSSPDLSPDGRSLVFDSQSANQEDLFVLDLASGATRRLTNDPFKDRLPTWSPDGREIAFFSNRTGKSEIWMIDTDGGRMRQLTHAIGAGVNTPMWSPDGRRLAYHQAGRTFIWSLDRPWDSAGVEEVPPLDEFPRMWTTELSWSPDGRKLAGFIQRGSEIAGIDVYAFDTRRHTRITSYGDSPEWMGDSERLLFVHYDKVLMADTRTGQVRQVTTVPARSADHLSLSRDDRLLYIAVTSTEADVWLRTTR